MLKVAPLIKYLSENNPQLTPARLTFYNYLSHLVEPDGSITDELIENFFSTSLDYAHWQQNKPQLGREVHQILELYSKNTNSFIDLSGIRWPHETQIVEIESLQDLTDAAQCYLNSIYKKGEKYRLLLDQDKKLLAVVLSPDQSVCVRYFDKKMIIRHGQLEPLRKDLCLYYSANLELDPEKVQKLEIAPFVTAQFQVTAQGLRGALVRGYVCQKFFDLRGENLAAHPKLFYAVKRMEQHFVNRETDPFYQENVSALEKAIELVKQEDPEALESGMDMLAKAQNALENVFMGDKLLGLLLRDLQHTLANYKQRAQTRTVVTIDRKADEIWNSTPKTTSSTNMTNPMNSTKNPPLKLQNRILERKFDLTN